MLNLLRGKRGAATKDEVWLVEDKEVIRETFKKAHEEFFEGSPVPIPERSAGDPRRTSAPGAAVRHPLRQRERPPDLEAQLEAEEARLRQITRQLGIGEEAGTSLVEMVRNKFKGSPPFPVYAYTSKAAMLMQTPDFDRLLKAEARWLFKDRYSAEAVRLILLKDIAEFRAAHTWRSQVWKHLRPILAVTGALGWAIGRIVEYFVLGK